MTVLNTANDGYYNVLIALYRAIATFGPMKKDRLLRLCSAGSISEPGRLRQTLNRWTQLGLFIEKNDEIHLNNNIKEESSGNGNLSNRERDLFPGKVRRVLFREENNKRFWDRDKTLGADLTRGLAFFMAQDIYSVDLGTHAAVETYEQQQIRDEGCRILTNSVPWGGLSSWGKYLGFFWQGSRLFIDPTRALREDLPRVFDGVETLRAGDFMSRVAEVLPVLDGGRYRIEVESVLDQRYWRKPGRADVVSSSLSRAIWRLRKSGYLNLESQSDASDGRSLQRQDGQDWGRFTHVSFSGGSK